MSLQSSTADAAMNDFSGGGAGLRERDVLSSFRGILHPRNIGGVYVLVALVVILALWIPDLFLTATTFRQVVNTSAVTAIVALSLVVPLSTGTFDLSVGYTMSLSGVTAAFLTARTDIGFPMAVVLALVVSLFVGAINGFIVVVMKVDSFIATLASGSLIMAFITMVTNQSPVTDVKLAGEFASFAQQTYNGFTGPVFYAIGIAVALWLLMQHTAVGRRMYAAGFNPGAARLAGIRVSRLRLASLLVSAVLAGFAGVALASTISSGAPSAGLTYLLPAYAAAFVGATQFQRGRFNAWGTLLAVVILGTGVTGLSLGQAPQWAADMFTGVVLILALAITGSERRALRGKGASKWRLFRKEETASAPSAGGTVS
jgi:ribose transport system permease protein